MKISALAKELKRLNPYGEFSVSEYSKVMSYNAISVRKIELFSLKLPINWFFVEGAPCCTIQKENLSVQLIPMTDTI